LGNALQVSDTLCIAAVMAKLEVHSLSWHIAVGN
jgi:hypothetical protein